MDLTKAYDTVHRGGLIRGFHECMNATLLLSGNESEKFNIRNGLRQERVLAPNVFLLYLTAVLTEAYGDLQFVVVFGFGVGVDLGNYLI